MRCWRGAGSFIVCGRPAGCFHFDLRVFLKGRLRKAGFPYTFYGECVPVFAWSKMREEK